MKNLKKIKNKKGFSLLEMTAIVLILGIMFIASSSFLKSRTTISEITKTEERLNQAYEIIIGHAGLKKLLPAIYKPNATDSFTLFDEMFNLPGGYGDNISYFPAYQLVVTQNDDRAQTNNICNIVSTNLQLKINSNTINNVAFVVISDGKNEKPDIGLTKLPASAGANADKYANIITINTSQQGFDDHYRYATLKEMRDIARCPNVTSANPYNILTKQLSKRTSQTDTVFSNSTATNVVTRDIIYTTNAQNQWCIIATNETVKKQFQARTIDTNINASNPIVNVYTPSGNCVDINNFTTPSYGLWLTLSPNKADLVPGDHIFTVYAKNPDGQIDMQQYKLTVPVTP